MRIIILLLSAFLFIISCCHAQTNTFPSSGNVGIGTLTPDAKLTLNQGSIKINNPASYPYGYNINMTISRGWAREYSFSANNQGKLFSLGVYGGGPTLHYGYIGGNTSKNAAYQSPWMVFLPNGNVGIGTKYPASKLAVNGTLTTKKIVVQQTSWADYVFDSAFVLPALSTLEQAIGQYGHLPGFPSAETIAEEGLDLSAMQQKQMAQIETFLLYLLQQQKQLKQQQVQIAALQQQIVTLTEQIKKKQ